MLTIKLTQKFKKDLDRTYRRGYDLSLLSNAIQLIAKGQIKFPQPRELCHSFIQIYLGYKSLINHY